MPLAHTATLVLQAHPHGPIRLVLRYGSVRRALAAARALVRLLEQAYCPRMLLQVVDEHHGFIVWERDVV